MLTLINPVRRAERSTIPSGYLSPSSTDSVLRPTAFAVD
jgi:hypothetical protein